MKVLVSTKNMSRKEWLEWRTRGVSGTDAAVIAGKNKNKSVMDLFLEKTKRIQPEETDNRFTEWGRRLEPLIRKAFSETTGLTVRQKNAIIYDEERPYMIGNVDGIVTEPNGEKALLEIKTAVQYREKEFINGVPESYRYQVMHYLSILGFNKCYMCCLIGGSNLIIKEIYRDEEMINEIREMEKHFWYDHVLRGIEPEVDGNISTTNWLNQHYDTSNGLEIQLSEELLPLFDEYDSVIKALEELNVKKEELCNIFRNNLRENEIGTVAGRMVKWKNVSSTRFNSSKFKEDNPELFEEYIYKNTYRRLQIA